MKKLAKFGYTQEAIQSPRVLESPFKAGELIGVGGSLETNPPPPSMPKFVREADQKELEYLKNLGCYEHLIVLLENDTEISENVEPSSSVNKKA